MIVWRFVLERPATSTACYQPRKILGPYLRVVSKPVAWDQHSTECWQGEQDSPKYTRLTSSGENLVPLIKKPPLAALKTADQSLCLLVAKDKGLTFLDDILDITMSESTVLQMRVGRDISSSEGSYLRGEGERYQRYN